MFTSQHSSCYVIPSRKNVRSALEKRLLQRLFLHSNFNCFYASIEMIENPSLRGKAISACGSTEAPHGAVIVLVLFPYQYQATAPH